MLSVFGKDGRWPSHKRICNTDRITAHAHDHHHSEWWKPSSPVFYPRYGPAIVRNWNVGW